MKGERYIVFLLAILLCACSHVPIPEATIVVRECASMPCGGRASASACALNEKAYIFAGRMYAWDQLKDLWEYKPQTDTWTQHGEAPMKARVNAVIAANNDKLYLGLGYAAQRAYQDTAYMHDWWEYTPASRQWKQLADFPSPYTVASLSFAIDNHIYVMYGTGIPGFSTEIWQYNIDTDTWVKTDNNPSRPKPNCGGRGAWSGGLYYYGTGYDTHNLTSWYSSDIKNDQWTICASIPGKGREFSACAANDTYVYLFGGQYFGGDITGGWEIFDSYMRYLPAKNQWEWCGQMPCGRAVNQIAFSINGKVYFGLGEDDKQHTIDKLYCIEE